MNELTENGLEVVRGYLSHIKRINVSPVDYVKVGDEEEGGGGKCFEGDIERKSETNVTLVISAGISSSPPQVADQAKLLQYTKTQGRGLAMFCPAQGFPIPAFR